MDIRLNELNKTIINCKKCPRLVKFVKKVSTNKRKQNINEIYWGKPVPGFGDLNSKIAIIGLAPAAHGGTRTGRPFTGDKSSDFLFSCLKRANISNLRWVKAHVGHDLNEMADQMAKKGTGDKAFYQAPDFLNNKLSTGLYDTSKSRGGKTQSGKATSTMTMVSGFVGTKLSSDGIDLIPMAKIEIKKQSLK